MSAVAELVQPRVRAPRGKPRALVIRAPGTNCDRETVLALELAGARAESMHIEHLLDATDSLRDFGIVVLPGGFSFGDHLGAGTLWAHRLEGLGDELNRFVAAGRPVLGICNGFQALLKLGLLEGGALAPNASGRFECRWVWLRRPASVRSPLLEGIDVIALPVAHGEGRFVGANPHPNPSPIATGEGLRGAFATDAIAFEPPELIQAAILPPITSHSENGSERRAGGLLYCDADGNSGGYPINPNGSDGDVAALTNAAGNVLGLMPHPERNVFPGQAPAGRQDGAGLAIFRNAVRLAKG